MNETYPGSGSPDNDTPHISNDEVDQIIDWVKNGHDNGYADQPQAPGLTSDAVENNDTNVNQEKSSETTREKNRKRGRKTWIAAALAVTAIGVGAFLISRGGANASNTETDSEPEPSPSPAPTEAAQQAAPTSGATEAVINDEGEIYFAGDHDGDVEEVVEEEAAIETTQFAGELPNGVRYDYTEYANSPGNRYGNSRVHHYGDAEAAAEDIIDVATRMPEALSATDYHILTEKEKAELGIDGVTVKELDDYFSNEHLLKEPGKLQQRLVNKTTDILSNLVKDGETPQAGQTSIGFELRTGMDWSYYLYNTVGEDGQFNPDNVHGGIGKISRNNAEQSVVYRYFNKEDLTDGELSRAEVVTNPDGAVIYKLRMARFNMGCPNQVSLNAEESQPTGVDIIEDATETGNTPVEDVKREETQPQVGGGNNNGQGQPAGGNTVVETGQSGGGHHGGERQRNYDDEYDYYVPPTVYPPSPGKDYVNETRISDNAEDLAEHIYGSTDIELKPTGSADKQEKTEKPTKEDYEGTEATLVQNNESKAAETVGVSYGNENGTGNSGGNFAGTNVGANAGAGIESEPDNTISGENDLSYDFGGTSDFTGPVGESYEPPAVEEQPTSGYEIEDILAGLGI